MYKRFIALLLILLGINSFAQIPARYHAGEIHQMLKKLNTLGSVLYVAAHPDDENTELITYFARGKHYRTAYLSATRGDGGQNLIGTEIREELGIIRTQELLAARNIDGGEQFFSRANDFGYSKHPDETFNIWKREDVLADFVWVIRNFKPDVLVTRFSQEPGITHGHHTGSAMLAMEGFRLSGDSTAFPEQLAYVDTWSPKKIFWNVGLWSYRRLGKKFDPTGHLKIDVGGYDPLLGYSLTEIAAKSRSSHKSQGFGQSGSRGPEYEYLKQWAGEETEDVFGGIDTRWSRVEGSEAVSEAVKSCLLNYDIERPEGILPDLLTLRRELLILPDQYWKEQKLKEVDKVIQAVTGLYLEMKSDGFAYVAGDSINITFEAINRSDVKMSLSGVDFSFHSENVILNLDLANNQSVLQKFKLKVPGDQPLSQPYWLQAAGSLGMYQVMNQAERGRPENRPALSTRVTIKIEDHFLDYDVPVVFKSTDRVKGEQARPIAITPKVMVNIENESLVFGALEPKPVIVRVTSGSMGVTGIVKLDLPKGWSSQPDYFPIELARKGEEQSFEFALTPSRKSGQFVIGAQVEVNQEIFNKGIAVINHDHIPIQTSFPTTSVKASKIDLKIEGEQIGYIMGAGDKVPDALEEIGYEVELLSKEDVTVDNLSKFDAVVLGIRAFNVLPWLEFKNQILFEYARSGGTVLVQYNTWGTVTKELAPYPLEFSRDRVSVEEAEVRILAPDHQVLNRPNKILKQDFENWVQERGLYFPNKWSEEFKPILSMNDPGEDPKEGSLLIARHGKGFYVYSGISFFRELPAGVPGAYRLLANILSLNETTNP